MDNLHFALLKIIGVEGNRTALVFYTSFFIVQNLQSNPVYGFGPVFYGLFFFYRPCRAVVTCHEIVTLGHCKGRITGAHQLLCGCNGRKVFMGQLTAVGIRFNGSTGTVQYFFYLWLMTSLLLVRLTFLLTFDFPWIAP